jgi:molecular chaperone GrpE (heat shock protein)
LKLPIAESRLQKTTRRVLKKPCASELKAAEHHDAWLRAKAETENVRRRAQEDIAKAAKFAIERFARELLAVKDSLEARAGHRKCQSVDSLRAGTEVTLKQLVAAFEKSALTEVNPLGEKFDPNRHQAISVVESEQEPNTVVTVCRRAICWPTACCVRRWSSSPRPRRGLKFPDKPQFGLVTRHSASGRMSSQFTEILKGFCNGQDHRH